jgi:hypothetical protein
MQDAVNCIIPLGSADALFEYQNGMDVVTAYLQDTHVILDDCLVSGET